MAHETTARTPPSVHSSPPSCRFLLAALLLSLLHRVQPSALRHDGVAVSTAVRQAFTPTEHDALVILFADNNGVYWLRQDAWLSGLSVCRWFGVYCDTTGTSVIGLDLSHNNLTGPFPTMLGYLPQLQRVILAGNRLTGGVTLPSAMPFLQSLDVSYNALTLPLPLAINVNWPWIAYLDVSHNLMPGSIPAWVGNSIQLTYLNFSGNFMSGSLPSSFCNLQSLLQFDVSFNNLSGTLPSCMGTLVWLTEFIISENHFSGTIPPTVGTLARMSNFDVGNNDFSGAIPHEVGDMQNLQILKMSNNPFFGPVPYSLGTLSYLVHLEMNSCGMFGSIPINMWNLVQLEVWQMADNRLVGTLPNVADQLLNLKELVLSNNNLQSGIPSSVGLMPNIKLLSLNGNCFTDIPQSVIYRCSNASNADVRFTGAASCSFQNRPLCTPVPVPANILPVALGVGIPLSFAAALAVLLFLRWRRTTKAFNDRPPQPELDPGEFQATKEKFALDRWHSQSELRVRNSETPRSMQFNTRAKLTVGEGRVPHLAIDTLVISPAGTPASKKMGSPSPHRNAAATPQTSRKPSQSPHKFRSPTKRARPVSAPALRPKGNRVLDANDILFGGYPDEPGMATPGRIMVDIPIQPHTPSTTRVRRSRTAHLAIPKPGFVDSVFVTDMPASADRADVAGAYLSAELFKDITQARSEDEVLDTFTRLFILKSQQVAVPRSMFKEACAEHRRHFPGLWSGRVLEGYHGLLDMCD